MKDKGRGISAATILTLALTAAVIAACVFVFARIQGGNPQAHMSAQKALSLVGDALQGATPAPVSFSTVRTVTVTLAPSPRPTNAPKKATATPAKDQKTARRSFTITVGGQIAFESDISDSVYDKATKSFDFTALLSPIRSRVDGDLTLAMLPQVLNTADQKYADALAPQSSLDGIKKAGFEYVLLNSNHALDQGIDGALKTVNALIKKKLTPAGVSAGKASQHPMIQLNGARIALLAYTDGLTAKGKIARESQPEVMQLFTLQQAQKDIERARKDGADFVIVSLSWGKADTASATSTMKKTAAALAEAGADLILGYRPTRVLPLETVNVPGDNGVQRQCLIAYSMGTMLTESRDGNDISGMLLNLSITCEKGAVHFDAISYTPTYIWRRTVNGKTQYSVVPSAEAAPKSMDAKQKEVMGRALNRIKNVMKNGPAEISN